MVYKVLGLFKWSHHNKDVFSRHVYLVVGSSPPRPPDAPSQVESEEAGPGGDVERFSGLFPRFSSSLGLGPYVEHHRVGLISPFGG